MFTDKFYGVMYGDIGGFGVSSGLTPAGMFSADETADVGIDLGTPVVEAIGSEAASRFTGRIPKVAVEVREAVPAAATGQ